MFECLQEWKDLWNDPRGPGKLLIVSTIINVILFFYLVIIVISGGIEA